MAALDRRQQRNELLPKKLESQSRDTSRASRRRGSVVPTQSVAPVIASQNHYRRAADTWAEDANGIVQVWNGIDKPRRFDPAVGSYETVGVIPPSSAMSISPSGLGGIIGEFFAYSRFIDRSGNISSLSPVSAMISALTLAGSITNATNSSPIVITSSGLTTAIDGDIVKITGVLGNSAANGVWSIFKLSSTTAALYTDGSLTTPSLGNGTWVSGGSQYLYRGAASLVYQNVPISTEAKVVTRQILRNKDGDASVFYIDIETSDLTSTTFTSNTDSASLINPVALFDVNFHSLVTKTVPPSYKKFVCFQNGRLFAAGNEPYSEGAVSITNGSFTVTGIGTQWGTDTFVGRLFEATGGTKQYEIASVQSATSLTLAEAYAGSTDPWALYSIKPADVERRTIYWSEPSEYEAWPIANTVTLSEKPGSGEITGLMAMRSFLYILSEFTIDKLSFTNDPLLDGKVFPATERGCVNNRCWVQIEQSAYALDALGIHDFSGNDDVDISTPAVQDLFRRNPSGKYRINWESKRNFHCCYSPGEDVIRWFVSLSGAYFPRHAICFHVRLKRWWLEEYPWGIGSACVGRMNGKPQLFLGTAGRRIMALGYSSLDGPDASVGTVKGTVTTAGINWIADSTASFATTGIQANSLTIVSGTGKGQTRLVSQVSGTKLYVTIPWVKRPDTTSVYQLGGVNWLWRSGWMRWSDYEYKQSRSVQVQYKPTTVAAASYLRLFLDLNASAQTYDRPRTLAEENGVARLKDDPSDYISIDSTKSIGYVTYRLDNYREERTDAPRFLSVELSGCQNQERQSMLRLIVEGAR